MTGHLTFISTISIEALFDLEYEEEPTDDEVIERAREVVAELWGQDGPPDPWHLTDAQLTELEATLPKEGKAR
jgi:hypothetical protein